MENRTVNASPSQKEAIQFAEGAMLVLAGPGSGKTHVITQRIRYLIESKGIHPGKILTITFTKAAALEMQKRCLQICPNSVGAVFGTFHSVFYKILRTSEQYRNFSLINEYEKKEIIKMIILSHRFASYSEEELLFECEIMLGKISQYKNLWPKTEQAGEADPHFLEILELYQRACKDMHKLDFDDMLILCHELFEQNPRLKKNWQQRFQYIQVDEFQDINGIQYELTKQLAHTCGNLFVVGDDDQAIYSFRGADPAYVEKFMEDFPLCKKVCLEENYRCGDKIVAFATKSIAKNKSHIPKQIRAANRFENEVNIQSFSLKSEEMEYLAHKASMLLKGGENVAVLTRTNSLAESVAEIFYRKKVAYQMKERRKSFYAQPIIRDIIAVAKYVFQGQKRKDFLMFMNKPYRGIQRTDLKAEIVSLTELFDHYRMIGNIDVADEIARLKKQCEFVSELDPYSAIHFVWYAMKYGEHCEKQNVYYHRMGYGNVHIEEEKKEYERLINELLQRARSFKHMSQFLSFVDSYEEECCNNKVELEKGEDTTIRVKIMTYHASKGLEFDHVFLPQLNQGTVPHGNMLTEEQISEERRMFYVATTRAKKSLHISYTENPSGENMQADSQKRSMFLEELQ